MENSKATQVSDLRQSPQYGRYMESIGWKVVQISNLKSQSIVQIFIKKLGPFGSIAKIQRFDEFPWKKIKSELRENKVWMTKVEPNFKFSISNFKFRQDSWPMLATKTLRVDLSPSLSEIQSQFKKDCRYELRKSQSANLKVQKNNFNNFYEIWKKAAGIKKLWIPSKKDFDSMVRIFGNCCFCITINDLAGSFVLIHDKTAFYYYSGALPQGKRISLPYQVIWECIKEAKKKGCTVWDFEGIFDPRWPNKGWKGFSHFKKSFGGQEVEFPGSFIKWF
jgi:hypothetical protein